MVEKNLARNDPWLLVFDLDGTLIDSSVDLWASVNAALTHVGHPPLPQEVINSFIGNGAATLVRRALAQSGGGATVASELFEGCFQHFLNYYRKHKLDNTRTYPGVLDSLTKIRKCKPQLLMAVLTNKPVRPSREICDALGLTPFLFANYGGDSFFTKKPEPEGLSAIISEATQVMLSRGSPAHMLPCAGVVMVGDSDVDVQVGRACGTRTLGCSYGLAPEALHASDPDLLVYTAHHWPRVLGLACDPA